MHLRRFTADVQELKSVETVVNLGNEIQGATITCHSTKLDQGNFIMI
jgi:hypothetical protein